MLQALLSGIYRTAKDFATALAANIANSAKTAGSLAEAEVAGASLQNVTGSSFITALMYKGPLPEWFSLRPMPVEVAKKHIEKLTEMLAILICTNIGLMLLFCLLWLGLLIWSCNIKVQLRRIEEEERRFVVEQHVWRKQMKKKAESLVPDEFLRKELVRAGMEYDNIDDA